MSIGLDFPKLTRCCQIPCPSCHGEPAYSCFSSPTLLGSWSADVGRTFSLSLHLDLTAFSAWSLFGDRDLLHPFPEMSRPMEVLSMQLLQACPVQMSTSLPSSIDQRCGHEMTHVQLGAFLLFQRFEGLVRKVSLHMSTDADLCNSSGPGFFWF